MTPQPDLLVLDVNETLSDLAPLRARWTALGVPEHLATQWFAEVLRDGFALAAAGSAAPFAQIARETARRVLRSAGVVDLDTSVAAVMAAFGDLDVHADVHEGLAALSGLGIRLVTLSNGATGVAESLLTRTGLRDQVERLLTVEDAPRWKPAPEAYRYALETCGVPAERAMLVAVHPWDVDGAARAGLRTAYLDRDGQEYPTFFTPPELRPRSLVELAEVWRQA